MTAAWKSVPNELFTACMTIRRQGGGEVEDGDVTVMISTLTGMV